MENKGCPRCSSPLSGGQCSDVSKQGCGFSLAASAPAFVVTNIDTEKREITLRPVGEVSKLKRNKAKKAKKSRRR